MMVGFIDAHRGVYGVEPICRMLPIAPSTYYEEKAREVDPTRLPPRAQRDEARNYLESSNPTASLPSPLG